MTDSPPRSFAESARNALAAALEPHAVAVESVDQLGSGSAGVVQVSVARRVLPEHLSIDTTSPLPGLTLDELAEVTPVITQALESLNPELFTTSSLEVTSPGLSAPLHCAEQFRRHVSRLVQLALHDGTTVTGRIVGVTHDQLQIQAQGSEPLDVPIAQITRGDVQVEFSRPKDQE